MFLVQEYSSSCSGEVVLNINREINGPNTILTLSVFGSPLECEFSTLSSNWVHGARVSAWSRLIWVIISSSRRHIDLLCITPISSNTEAVDAGLGDACCGAGSTDLELWLQVVVSRWWRIYFGQFWWEKNGTYLISRAAPGESKIGYLCRNLQPSWISGMASRSLSPWSPVSSLRGTAVIWRSCRWIWPWTCSGPRTLWRSHRELGSLKWKPFCLNILYAI